MSLRWHPGLGEHQVTPASKEITMANPVVHFEVIGKDGDKTKQFFTELFGWGIDSSNPMNYGLVDPGEGSQDRGIAGGVAGAMEGGPAHITVYIEVADIESTLAKAEELGGKKLFGPETIMEGVTLAQFADPDGTVVGLLQAPATS
jgi:predicted enzyme related to lactoylglutathione lyase